MKKLINWFKDLFKVPNCCGDCENYRGCYWDHLEVHKQNTLDNLACDKFKEVELND